MPPEKLNPKAGVRAQGDTAGENPIGCFVRVAWLGANVAPVLIAANIYRDKIAAASLASALYWASIVLAIVLHYFEVTRLHANALSGAPATLGSWRRYSLGLLLFAGALWGLALAFG